MKSKFLIIISVIVTMNILSVYMFVRWDWTQGKLYSISDATVNIMDKLEEPVTIKAFFTADLPPQILPIRQFVSDILNEYQAYGGSKISISFIDPASDQNILAEANQLGIQTVRMQVRENDSLQIKTGYLGLALFYKDKKEVIPLIQNQDLANFEYTLSSLILKMSLSKLPILGFLEGHGEHDLSREYSLLAQSLTKNYAWKTINFAEGDTLENIDVLFVAGPRKNIPDRDIFEIDQYLLKGGKALFFIDAVVGKEGAIEHEQLQVNARDMFIPWGIKMPAQILMDRASEFGQFSEGPGRFFVLPYPPFIRFSNFSQNPVVKQIQSFVMRFVSPLDITEIMEIKTDIMVSTSDAAWSIDPPFQLSPTAISSSDKTQSYPVMVEISGKLPRISNAESVPILQRWKDDKLETVPKDDRRKNRAIVKTAENESKAILVSDSDFVSNDVLEQDPMPLVITLNMLDSLTLGDELISIRSKPITVAPIRALEPSQKRMAKIIGIALMPVLITAYGVGRLMLRRKKERLAK